MTIAAAEAIWFLPFAAPVALWVAFTDLKDMKILNIAAGALALVFLVIGLIALPFDAYLWRLLHMVAVLAIGFILNMLRILGGGDAKFMAAMAPFIAPGDAFRVILLFAAILILSFFLHRILRRIPAIRRATPEWQSWDHAAFPMGVALAVVLIAYLGMGALSGA